MPHRLEHLNRDDLVEGLAVDRRMLEDAAVVAEDDLDLIGETFGWGGERAMVWLEDGQRRGER